MPSPDARSAARVDFDDGVLQVVLCRPHWRNPLDLEAFSLIHDVCTTRALDDDVRVLVVRGEGDDFCSGLDRRLLVALASGEGLDHEAARAMQDALVALETCPRPTICVVRGACIGGGVELALACDIRVASTTARFSLMEMQYGFLPDLGAIHRLLRDVGLTRAKEMIYFGEPVPAPVLATWGVLNEVVEDGDLDACAGRWVERCLAAPPLAIRAAKRLLDEDPAGLDRTRSLADALHENEERLLRSADFREGLTAALERRRPRFSGR